MLRNSHRRNSLSLSLSLFLSLLKKVSSRLFTVPLSVHTAFILLHASIHSISMINPPGQLSKQITYTVYSLFVLCFFYSSNHPQISSKHIYHHRITHKHLNGITDTIQARSKRIFIYLAFIESRLIKAGKDQISNHKYAVKFNLRYHIIYRTFSLGQPKSGQLTPTVRLFHCLVENFDSIC